MILNNTTKQSTLCTVPAAAVGVNLAQPTTTAEERENPPPGLAIWPGMLLHKPPTGIRARNARHESPVTVYMVNLALVPDF